MQCRRGRSTNFVPLDPRVTVLDDLNELVKTASYGGFDLITASVGAQMYKELSQTKNAKTAPGGLLVETTITTVLVLLNPKYD